MGGWGEVIGGPKVWARDLGLAVVIGIAVAFLGPFDSYQSPLEHRLLTSVSYGVVGSAVMWPFMRLAMRLGARAGLPDWFTIPAGLVLVAWPVTGTSRLVSDLLPPDRPPPELLSQYFGVLAIVFPLGLAIILFDRRGGLAPSAAGGDVGAAEPRLLARLPGRLGRDVMALQAEDHYVRVHTALGSDLLLMRFADAVAEADGIDGLRVHRSWWVARSAVESAKGEGRRAMLTLRTGLSVPVTRESVPEIRRAGWL
jgi:hypothetical protein